VSIRLAAIKAFLRLVVKRRLRRMTDIREARTELAIASDWIFRAPPFAWYREGKLAKNLDVLWVETRPYSCPAPSEKVILYLHGGGFVAGDPWTYRKFLARLSQLAGIRVCAPNYRKAPEHPFPAAVEDCECAYESLLNLGYQPHNIVVGGDSAGGGLCFSLLGRISDRLPAPHAIFVFSPIVDLSFSSSSFTQNAEKDPVLPADRTDIVSDSYLVGIEPATPAVSPILYDFASPPPVFIQFSSTEILRDESLRMAEKLHQAGGEVELDEWPDAPHVWVLLDGIVPEAREALSRAACFIRRQLRDETPDES